MSNDFKISVLYFFICFCVALNSPGAELQSRLIASFEGEDPEVYQLWKTVPSEERFRLRGPKPSAFGIVPVRATHGFQALKLTSAGTPSAGMDFFFFKNKDWRGFKSFSFDVYNPNEKKVPLKLLFRDEGKGVFWYGKTLGPRSSKTFTVPVSAVAKKLDISKVKSLYLLLDGLKEKHSLIFDCFRLDSDVPLKKELGIQKQPELKMPVTEKRPEVDAVFDEAWQGALKTAEFKTNMNKEAKLRTEAWLMADTENMYVYFVCHHPDGKITAKHNDRVKEHDSAILSSDDCVEVFLDCNRDKDSYYQILLNPNNVAFEARSSYGTIDASWNPVFNSATKIKADRWEAEIAIPFSSLRSNSPLGEKWGINLTRERQPGHGYFCLFPTMGGFHRPNMFGELLFPKHHFNSYKADFSMLSAGEGRMGENRFRFKAENPYAKELPIEVLLSVMSDGEKENAIKKNIRLAGGSAKEYSIDYKLTKTGNPSVRADFYYARSNAKQCLYSSGNVEIKMQPALEIKFNKPHYANTMFASEKPESIEGRVLLNVEPEFLKDKKLRVSLTGETGFNLEQTYELATNIKQQRFSFQADKMNTDFYAVKAVLVSGDGAELDTAETEIRNLPASPMQVKLDRLGNVVANGKRIFPIGVFFAPLGYLAEIKDCNFNTVHIYHNRNLGDYLSEVRANDLYLIASFNHHILSDKADFDIWKKDALERLTAFPQNDRLLAWYLIDEPVPVRLSPERLEEAYRFVKKNDPYRPVIALFMRAGLVELYRNCGDILTPDNYPNFVRTKGNQPNLVSIARDMDITVTAARGEKATWMTLPVFDNGKCNFRKDTRVPNYRELRLMSWLSIIHGAKGLLHYGWCCNNQSMFEEWGLKEGIKAVNAEVLALQNAIFEPSCNNIITTGKKSGGIHFLCKKLNGKVYVFAANPAKKTVNAKFRINGVNSALNVVSENRNVFSAHNFYSDTFAPNSVHIYTNASVPVLPTLADVAAKAAKAEAAWKEERAKNLLAAEGVVMKVSSFLEDKGSLLRRGAEHLNDGYRGSNWITARSKAGKFPAWATAELPEPKNFNRIIFRHTFIKDCDIQAWVNGAWKTIGTIRDNTDVKDPAIGTPEIKCNLEQVKSDRLRVMILDSCHVNKNTVIGEIELYGDE